MQNMKRTMTRGLTAVLAVIILVSSLMGGMTVSAYSTDYPNTWTNTGNQIEDLIGVAMTQVGYWGTEYGTGTKYGAWYGMTYAPWCGMFISWCANQAGIPTSVILKSARANEYRRSGTYHYKDGYTPKRGDLVLYNPNDGNGYFFPAKNSDGTYCRSQHVAIVCSYNPSDDTICIVHGNATGDRVCYSTVSVSNICLQAFVTPPYSGNIDPGITEPDHDFINDASGARLRTGPGINNSYTTVLPYRTALDVLETVKDDNGDDWYRVKVLSTGQEGYVFAQLVTLHEPNQTDTKPKDSINGDAVRMRSEPSTATNANIIAYLNSGQVVTVLEKTTDAQGDEWYKVSAVVNGQELTGYVYGVYVTVVEKDVPTSDPLAHSNYINATSVRMRTQPIDGTPMTYLDKNQIVNILTYVQASDGSKWYYAQASVSGTVYEGYIAEEFVTVNQAVDASFTAALDTPTSNSSYDLSQNTVMSIRGWAFSSTGRQTCYYQVDSLEKKQLLTYSRPDVKAAFGSACPGEGETVGFYEDVNISGLTPGEHTLSIIGISGTVEKVLEKRTFTVTDTTAPVASQRKVTDISADGFTLSIKITDNTAVANVRMAVWTASNDQRDITWTTVEPDENGAYVLSVKTANYQTADDAYCVHTYAKDAFGNEACVDSLVLNPTTYAPAAVRYVSEGAEGLPEMQYCHYLEEALTISKELPTKENHVFMGWTTDPSAQSVEYLPQATARFTQDTILYAVWKDKSQLEPGDINADGTVDVTDLFELKMYIAALSNKPIGNLDCNKDGLVDTADLVFLKKKLAGMID